MRLRTLFVFLFSFFFVIGIGIGIYSLVNSGQDSFNHQIEDYLNGVIDVNAERINDFVDEMEGDVLFLSELSSTREILKKDLAESVVAAKLGVGDKVKVIAKEVDNYLKVHPDMTLKELQVSEEFLSIAVQDIGNNGYSGIVGVDDTITYFHVNPDTVGKKIIDINADDRLVDVINDARITGFGDGFYTLIGDDGISREKYLEAGIVGQKTADGIGFMSVVAVEVDDYLVAKNVPDRINENLKRFKENKGYFHVLFVSPGGLIVHMAKPVEGIGVSILFSDIGIANMYSKLDGLKRGDVIFYGPFVGHKELVGLQIASASSVYDGDEFLGSIILVKNIRKFKDILEKEDFFRSGDEDYLVNKNGLLITPLRTRDVDVLVQEVKTVNFEKCIGDFSEAKRLNMTVKEYNIFEKERGSELALLPFQNFEGDLTYGLHRPIDKVEWCLLSEVSVEEVLYEPREKSFRNQVIFRIWILAFVIVLVIIGSFFIDKKYVLKRRKVRKYPCGYIGIMRPIACVSIKGKCGTYPNGKCGLIIKCRNFFISLKMRYYFLFALVFAIAYFFIVTSFFQGWQNAKLFDDIPDLFIGVVGVMIFATGMKIKKINARGYFIWGGLLISLRRIFDIPFQEWQELLGVFLGAAYWIPVVTIEFVGFLFLLIGYRRLKYG